MYYTEEIQLHQAEELLRKCGLSVPEGVDYTAGIFDNAGVLAATGSLKGDMIQGVAVDPVFQGEDLTGKVLTHLISKAKDAQSLYLFTKPEKVLQFTSLGFRLVAKARPYAALLEWGQEGVKQYQRKLETMRAAANRERHSTVGALVMNCNPFTLGHRYLIEQATKECDHVYVLVVEEDLSRFPFADRFQLVQQGTADLTNVTVISGGRYAVSTLTFPSYFTKDEKIADAHAAMDAELFSGVIAPVLGVTKRFVGTEPLSPVTNIYNETLKERLPKQGIQVVEIPRIESGDTPISASRVRALLDIGGEEAWEEIQRLVPQTTYDYLRSASRKVTLIELLDSREKRVMHQQMLLEQYDGLLISMTLNVPGPIKDKPAYRRALEMGMERMMEKIGSEAILHREINYLPTGSEGYLCVSGAHFDGKTLKEIAITVEEADELGRLFDIDVVTDEGSISRSCLGLGGRKCLLCGEDAKVCARSQRHELRELLAKIDEILWSY